MAVSQQHSGWAGVPGGWLGGVSNHGNSASQQQKQEEEGELELDEVTEELRRLQGMLADEEEDLRWVGPRLTL